ncbi:MAG: hypothetical protein HYS05_12230 [Acidobacteria bacterium]|nr:hypothetical protein [Acidobacteriota bacterium]
MRPVHGLEHHEHGQADREVEERQPPFAHSARQDDGHHAAGAKRQRDVHAGDELVQPDPEKRCHGVTPSEQEHLDEEPIARPPEQPRAEPSNQHDGSADERERVPPLPGPPEIDRQRDEGAPCRLLAGDRDRHQDRSCHAASSAQDQLRCDQQRHQKKDFSLEHVIPKDERAPRERGCGCHPASRISQHAPHSIDKDRRHEDRALGQDLGGADRGAEQPKHAGQHGLEQRKVLQREIEVRSRAARHQKRKVQVGLVLDPQFRVEHAHDARRQQENDEHRDSHHTASLWGVVPS